MLRDHVSSGDRSRWRGLGALSLLFCAAGAASADDQMLVRVDDNGDVIVTDRVGDPRLRTYVPGDFEAWMRGQLAYAHAPRIHHAAPRVPEGLAPVIADAALRYGVPAHLVSAVVAVESGFDTRAVSRAGAQGLMQLMPATARDLGVEDPFDPRANVDGGTRYLAGLLSAFGDEELALAAYNAGPGRVARLGRVPEIPETVAYVRAVRAIAAAYAQVVDEGGAP